MRRVPACRRSGRPQRPAAAPCNSVHPPPHDLGRRAAQEAPYADAAGRSVLAALRSLFAAMSGAGGTDGHSGLPEAAKARGALGGTRPRCR